MYLLTVDIIRIELFPDTSSTKGLKHLKVNFRSRVRFSITSSHCNSKGGLGKMGP